MLRTGRTSIDTFYIPRGTIIMFLEEDERDLVFLCEEKKCYISYGYLRNKFDNLLAEVV